MLSHKWGKLNDQIKMRQSKCFMIRFLVLQFFIGFVVYFHGYCFYCHVVGHEKTRVARCTKDDKCNKKG